tara:strand:- start:285 stop:986 length:702 start_codon:yes stop_codon:yes gene_type:complete
MSDSLVLKGVKDVRKHAGTEMLRLNPKGGGDTFQLKRWWVPTGVNTVYEDCTVFNVTTGAGTVKLAVQISMASDIRIDHDGSFNFSFFNFNQVSRAALFTDTFELIEHYVFPSISGGKIMTVTPSGGPVRPSASPIAFTGDGSITGTLEVGSTLTITSAPYTGGKGTVTLKNILQSSDDGNAPWIFVAQSTSNSFTHVIGAGLDTKFLRESTQLTDNDGLSSRNGSAQGPVTS